MTPRSSATIRRLGLAAVLAGAIGLLIFPFHAASYHATADGADSARAWSAAFRDALPAAFAFGSPDDVYLAYGRAFLAVAAGFLAGAVGLHAWQRAAGGRLMRASFRLLAFQAALLVVAALVLYWIPGALNDAVFFATAVPAFLLTMVAYPLYGVATYRARVAPRLGAWLMILGAFPGFVLMTALVGHLGAGFVLLHVAWIVVGRAVWKSGDAAPRAAGDVAPAA